MAKTVRDTMTTQPASVERSRPVTEAARLMRDRNVGSLPVVEGERVVGMLGLRRAVREARWRTGIGLGL